MDVRDLVVAERLALAARLRTLSAEEWATPSLCAGWTVRHVLAHVVTPLAVPKPRLAAAIARSGGIGAGMDRLAHDLAERDPTDLLDLLERRATRVFVPPGLPYAAPLTDVVVHGVDITWPLGDDHADPHDPARLAPCLDFLTSRRADVGFLPPSRLKGLRLVATDLDHTWGDGAEIAGAALHVAAAALGRLDALAHLDGPGVTLLSSRLS